MNCTSWNASAVLGTSWTAGFQGSFAMPFSSGTPPLRFGTMPAEMARRACPEVARLERTVCSWSSKTKTSSGGPFAPRAAGSKSSSRLTLKYSTPCASFIARKEAAIPPELARNFRRLTPSFFETLSA